LKARRPFRIIIRAHTARRDAAHCILLAKIFERMGCKASIASTRDYAARIRLWRPDAIVILTNGPIRETKALAPRARLVYLDGEGFQAPGYTNAEWWQENRDAFDMLDLVLVWGNQALEDFNEFFPEAERSKIQVVGSPKLDLVRLLPDRYRNTDRSDRSIGLVARFPNINDHRGMQPLLHMKKRRNVDRLIVQCNNAWGFVSAIRAIIEKTSFRISIRPHPNEQLELYPEFLRFWIGEQNRDRAEIDDSLAFPVWASSQKALISPTSTSFLEAYLLGIPVINLDMISGTEVVNRQYAETAAGWQAGGMMPETTDQMCELLERGASPPVCDETINNQLTDICDWHAGRSACLRAARAIVDDLNNRPPERTAHWPRPLVDLRDEFSFWQNMRRNPLHQNFNYKKGYHPVPAVYDEMAERAFELEHERQESGPSIQGG